MSFVALQRDGIDSRAGDSDHVLVAVRGGLPHDRELFAGLLGTVSALVSGVQQRALDWKAARRLLLTELGGLGSTMRSHFSAEEEGVLRPLARRFPEHQRELFFLIDEHELVLATLQEFRACANHCEEDRYREHARALVRAHGRFATAHERHARREESELGAVAERLSSKEQRRLRRFLALGASLEG